MFFIVQDVFIKKEWNLREVSELLLDELQHCRTLQKWVWCIRGILSNLKLFRHTSLNAAVKTILHEYKFLQNLYRNEAKEKEKIWSDLLLANERSAALAVEIDEQNAVQDKIIKSKIEVSTLF